jgi:cob(I)alamin adenosyltransferase
MKDTETAALESELVSLEDELDYQVSHKRIKYLQERIDEIEKEIAKRKEAIRNDSQNTR